jgi:hypothetical protein
MSLYLVPGLILALWMFGIECAWGGELEQNCRDEKSSLPRALALGVRLLPIAELRGHARARRDRRQRAAGLVAVAQRCTAP